MNNDFENNKKNKSKGRTGSVCVGVATIAFLVVGLAIPLKICHINKKELETDQSVLSQIINLSGEVSEGFDHGIIYSIEGIPISTDVQFTYVNEEGEVIKEERHCALPAFTPVIGVSGISGMINKCNDVLYSSDYKSNIMKRRGDDIQTTLSYNGQIKATELLDAYFPQSICESATVSVVLQDGAILVAAGNNSYTYTDVFDYDNKPEHFAIDYTTENLAVGSVAKALTGRALLLNNDKLSKEDSLYNKEYEDLSFFTIDNYTIHNWDYDIESNYPKVVGEDNLRSRCISLKEALKLSSNTYFLRHSLSFGLQNTYNEMERIYQMSVPIETEIYTLPGVQCNRLPFFVWGQDFYTNSIRLATLYNTALSSKAYVPFYVTSVYTPDDELLYKATPSRISDISFEIEDGDILKEALSECFKYYSGDISAEIIAPYADMIKDNRFLAKSGTAEVDESNHLENNTRVLTVLDDNKDVIATACIIVERAGSEAPVNNNVMFSILFQTLESSGVL